MSHKDLVFPETTPSDDEDTELDELIELIGIIEKHPMEELTIEDILQKKVGEIKAKDVDGKKAIAFGSGQDRPIIPNKFPFTRSGITSYYRSYFPMGPATYNSEKWTSNHYEQQKRTSTSKYGWGFGILNEKRFRRRIMDYNIDPGQYQNNVRELQAWQQVPPFGRSDPRFKKIKSIVPGAGTYNPKFGKGGQLQNGGPSIKSDKKSPKGWSYEAKTDRRRNKLEQHFKLQE